MNFYTTEIRKGRDLREFIRFPWKIYRGDPNWVPPLRSDMHSKLDPRRNPFFQYGEVRLFGVHGENQEMAGRIAAIYNPVHCQIHHESAGFFGLFEAVNSVDVARRLIGAAGSWLARYKCTHLVGPVNFTVNDEAGLLIEGYDKRPMVMCDFSPPYYAGLLEACGGQKAMDLISYGCTVEHPFPQKYLRVLRKASSNSAIGLRPFVRHSRSREISVIREIYNASFEGIWGFVPVTRSETEALARSFIPLLDDELVWIAEYEKRPVGFILALPDANEILKGLNGRLFPFGIFRFLLGRRRLKGVRVIVLCVLPSYRGLGIETSLIHRVHTRMKAGGYERAELSVVNENNLKMRRILESLGFQPVNRYRIYRLPMEDTPRLTSDTGNGTELHPIAGVAL